MSYSFGYPISISAGGVTLDIPLNVVTASNSNNQQEEINFKLQAGIIASALEHVTPEQLFNTNPTNPPNAFSAVKGLQLAAAEGQRIYQITQANQTTTLPNLNLDVATETEIQNAVNAGKEVITHTDLVSVPGYTGAGYIIIDPVTGDGAYKIGGGKNGSILIIEMFFEMFWRIFDSVKGVARANIVVTALNFFKGVSDILSSCTGNYQWGLIGAYLALAGLMVALSFATGGAGAMLVYSLVFNTASSVVVDAGIQKFCD